MNVSGILEAIQQGQIPGRINLSFAADGDSTLTVGNIVKGKVMRHYEGNRYSVDFSGRERVVDSAIPLKTGELIRGRVLAVDDKVYVQRIQIPETTDLIRGSVNRNQLNIDLPGARVLLQLFEQYQMPINNTQLREVGPLVARAANPDLMALSALILSKMGSRLEPEFLRAIYRHLQANEAGTTARNNSVAPSLRVSTEIPTETAARTAEPPLVPALAELLRQQHARYDALSQIKQEQETHAWFSEAATEMPQTDSQSARGQHDTNGRNLSNRLLNVQNDNSVAHRMIQLPIWVGDSLVEIEIAFFAQKEQNRTVGNTAGFFRKIVFSLETDVLGHVEVVVHLANRNARVEFVTSRSESSAMLARYSSDIEAALLDLGWDSDELSYRTATEVDGGVLGSVVEHYITQNSFSRLM